MQRGAGPQAGAAAEEAARGPVEVALVEGRGGGARRRGAARLEAVSLACAVDGVADVGAGEGEAEEDELHEEPGPAAGLLLARHARGRLAGLGVGRGGRLAGVAAVQVERLDRDDVEVVRELARLGGEAQVGDGRDLEVGDLEAEGVLVFGLVLQLELEERVLEVGDAGFGGDLGVADAAGLDTLA